MSQLEIYRITGTAKGKLPDGRRPRAIPVGDYEFTRKNLIRDVCKKEWREHAQSVIAKWRLQRGFTIKMMAELLGVHIQTVKKWESGENPAPLHLIFALRFLEEQFPVH